jgi:acyl carrier protein phosphodiesterase
MISDFVEGKKQFEFSISIQKGIQLHRAIDNFTDLHPSTKEAKLLLKPAVGAYAGAFLDIVYDHFLALDTKELTEEAWKEFAKLTYQHLFEQKEVMPEKFARMLPYMASQNWLYNYRFTEGIEKSFGGLVRRAKYLDDHLIAFNLFMDHYKQLETHYKTFFPDVKKFAESYLDERLLE